MTNRLLNLLPDVTDTLRRFPVAALVAVVTFVIMNGLIAVDNSFERDMDWFLNGAAAFLGAGIGHLFAEGRRWSSARNIVAALVGALVAGCVLTFYNTFQTFEGFLLLGLWLLLMVAGYFRGSAKQGALWLFNMKLYLAAALAVIVAVLFGTGLSAIVAGLDFLFGISMGGDVYQHIWYTAATLVGPLYGLSLMPVSLEEEINIDDHKDTIVERALSVVVNYVLVPLVVVYAVILHAYAVKIILNWALPKGEIGFIVSLFAAGGTATWLLAWPWREHGTRVLRLFMRAWFWLLPVPVVLLMIAIWRRVADYGVTPDRFGIALVAVWAAIVFAYLLWRRNRADMRVLVGSAAALLLVSSFGPQGAYAVTARDQFARLTALLEKSGIISAGKFVKKVEIKYGDDTLSSAYSMLMLLGQVRAIDRVQAWFGLDAIADKGEGRSGQSRDAYAYTEKLGLNYNVQAPEQVNISAYNATELKVPGAARIVGPVNVTNLQVASTVPGAAVLPTDMTVSVDKREFRLKAGSHEAVMPIAELMTTLKALETNVLASNRIPQLDLDAKVTLLIQSAYGTVGATPELNSMNCWIVVRE